MTNNKIDNTWRKEVIACALEYANYVWKPTSINAYHGYDVDGILVNTPDIGYISSRYQCGWWQENQSNRGVPYNWGGCSTIAEFEHDLSVGKYAGNVPDFRDNGVSKHCVGIDCSGLVTICWGVPQKLSTKIIPTIASPLEDMNLLIPGDIILKTGSHVMIFMEFTDEDKKTAQIIDATRSTGRVLLRTVQLSELYELGYVGYYKNN